MYRAPFDNSTFQFSQTQNSNNIQSESNLNEDKIGRQLPDILKENLDMIIIGIAPSAALGYSNHHFSGPGNHFWRCIAEVGLVPGPVTCEDDYRMRDYGIGFISFCTRPSKSTTEMSRKDIKAGAAKMVEKIQKYRPKIVVFNGIGIYEAFVGNKNFSMGLQPNKMDKTDAYIFVMPSSSARCAQLPRAEDKLPFFASLRKLRDHIRGLLPHLEERDVVFQNYTEFRVTQPDPRSLLKAERRRKRKAEEINDGNEDSEGGGTPKRRCNNNDSKKNNQKEVVINPNPETTFPNFSNESLTHSPLTTNVSLPNFSQQQQQNQQQQHSIVSWSHPQTNHPATGLIIHTGQPIIMPAANNNQISPNTSSIPHQQTPNTFLLLDPNSFIPAPVQVRPINIEFNKPTNQQQINNTNSNLNQVNPSVMDHNIQPLSNNSSVTNNSPNLQTTSSPAADSLSTIGNTGKNSKNQLSAKSNSRSRDYRKINQQSKSSQFNPLITSNSAGLPSSNVPTIMSNITYNSNNNITMPSNGSSGGSSCSSNCTQPATMDTNLDQMNSIINTSSLTINQISSATNPELFSHQFLQLQTDKFINKNNNLKQLTRPITDPTSEWDLFMFGIDMGDHPYPAPPHAIQLGGAKSSILVNSESIIENTPRILTVL